MKSMNWLGAGIALAALAACQPASENDAAVDGGMQSVEEASTFTVLVGGTPIGALEIATSDDGYAIDYEYRNNGRGPTMVERVRLDENGLPESWSIEGASTFGNPIDESFEFIDGEARWTDNTGSDQAVPAGDAFYVPESASPYWLAIAARALIEQEDGRLAALPGGELSLSEIEALEVTGEQGDRTVTSYALSGTGLNPTYFLMYENAFFGIITPGFAILEAGYEGEDERLRGIAAEYGARRFEEIQQRVVHDYEAPVRIANVRIFDSRNETLGEPVSVLVVDNRIDRIEAADARADGEVVIDGAGGTLVPGLFDMHGHMGETSAFLNIAAGVTSVRDMGNNNDVLDGLEANIQSGRVAGPRLFRSGFIEGRSPFNSNNGILVSNEEEAVAAVQAYAERGFHQVKIYNSMNPDWIPAVIAEAHAQGMRVAGHVPAFTNADVMIAAGYDEMTHINQIALGWVLEEGEDTRSLLRLTALRRLPGLDLNSERVLATMDAMVERGVALDPTYAIHEALLLSRNGTLSQGVVDYIDNMPVSNQRSARTAWADIANAEDDANYRGAFDQLTEVLRMMYERGIFMVPGTDLGGSFTLHRELELYQNIGMTPAEIVGWGSWQMADYLGAGDDLGTIEPGKIADFFLIPGDPTQDFKAIKTISMVMADGRVYYPTEIYPEFGIQPFTDIPNVMDGR